MRSYELVIMRPDDIDMADDVWIYEAYDHKNRWRGHRKPAPLGPKAQAIIRPFLDRDKESHLFSPREAEAWRLERRPVHYKAKRKTPVYPSELRAREKAKQARRRRKPKRPKRDHYDTDSYRRAIVYGLKKARKSGVEIRHWHPHQLRHSRGTAIRRKYGIEAAQVALGHARADVTQVYAEKNLELAKRIAREMGYAWAEGRCPDDLPLSELPAEIVAALQPTRSSPSPIEVAGDVNIEDAIRRSNKHCATHISIRLAFRE